MISEIFKNKVVVKIYGGLGNQLFQYAVGRAIAVEKNIPLWLDISFFKNDIDYGRVFVLNQFDIKADIIMSNSYLEIKYIGRLVDLYKKIDRCRDKKYRTFVNEPDFLHNTNESMENYFTGGPCHRFNETLLSETPKNIVLNGYWQSEKYFKNIKSILFEDLKIIANIPEAIQDFATYIESVNAICIGIRQYTDSEASSNHFKLTAEYYEEAMTLMSEKVKNPHFFIFTLETKWAEEHIKSDFPITIVPPSKSNKNAYMDLYLLTKCKHFIIANSTYHWWGAYLATYKEKIVVAPSKGWGNSEPLPGEWLTI